MNFIPVKTPKLIKGIFPKYTWNMPQDQKVIYLTFDDGPTLEITKWTLDLLKSYNAKATFFCIGNNIETHPQIFNDILRDGHAIGNHTFDHPKGWTTNVDVYVNQVLKTERVINFEIQNSKFKIPNPQSQTSEANHDQNSTISNHQSTINNPTIQERQVQEGQHSPTSKLFRPPYGQITSRQGKRLLDLGYKIIMWDILAFDWRDSTTPEECAENVISKAGNGSIIVFHDSVKASIRMKFALAKTLEHFSQQGYLFKSL